MMMAQGDGEPWTAGRVHAYEMPEGSAGRTAVSGQRRMDRASITVRAVVAEDIEPLEQALSSGFAAKHGRRYEMQRRGEATYLIAWLGDDPIGHALVRWSVTVDEPVASVLRDCPNIEDLLVRADLRSAGAGTRLLAEAERLARGRGFARIGLAVATDNPRARRLYERLGYAPAGFPAYDILCGAGADGPMGEEVSYLVKPLTGPAGRER